MVFSRLPPKFFIFLAELAAGIRTVRQTSCRSGIVRRPIMSEREIFDAALTIDDPVERAAYLEHVCAGDADLRQHIEGLLSVHGEVGNFLEMPAAALVNTAEAPA